MLRVADLWGPAGDPFLAAISLEVPYGATHAVIGPIHSGKSLLLRHIVGLERPERGAVIVAGDRFDATAPDDVLARMRRRIGVVFEGSALISRLTALENVELPLLEHAHAAERSAREVARALLAEVGLRGDVDTVPAMLFRADQRRVALARALALRPALLLVDEPGHRLDAHAASQLDETIERLQAAHGFGVLLCSHEARYAFGRAETTSVMVGGRIVAQGGRDELDPASHEVVRQLVDRRGAA